MAFSDPTAQRITATNTYFAEIRTAIEERCTIIGKAAPSWSNSNYRARRWRSDILQAQSAIVSMCWLDWNGVGTSNPYFVKDDLTDWGSSEAAIRTALLSAAGFGSWVDVEAEHIEETEIIIQLQQVIALVTHYKLRDTWDSSEFPSGSGHRTESQFNPSDIETVWDDCVANGESTPADPDYLLINTAIDESGGAYDVDVGLVGPVVSIQADFSALQGVPVFVGIGYLEETTLSGGADSINATFNIELLSLDEDYVVTSATGGRTGSLGVDPGAADLSSPIEVLLQYSGGAWPANCPIGFAGPWVDSTGICRLTIEELHGYADISSLLTYG